MAKPEQQQEMSAEQRAAILERVALTLVAKRKSAIEGRLSSGIEQIWTEDQAHYDGYDDANRHEFNEVKSKPTEGGRTTDIKTPRGSTLFPNITAPYVDAAAAKVADMLLPTDDRNFVIEPTPVPDILDEEEGWPEIVPPPPVQPAQPAGMPAGQMPAAPMPAQGGAMAAMAAPQQATPAAAIMADPAQAAQPPVDPLEVAFKKLAEIRQKALDAAKKAQDQVDDFLTECYYHTELRKVIHDAARIGTGVVKGPVPERREVKVWAKNPQTGERELVIKIETKPTSKCVSAWNLFPDYPACGENIHDGSFIWERAFFGPKKLLALKGGEGPAAYIDSEIDAAIKEGPARTKESGRGPQQNADHADTDVFDVWYFYGSLTGEEMAAAGCECEDPLKQYPVIVTMVNDRVIKAAKNHLDSGEFPFDVLAWKSRPGMPWGSGVARQGRTAQRICTAATRNLMDNAGASSRPHKVMTDAIDQDGDPWTWRAGSDATDVTKAMQFFVQPSLQSELMNIIQLGEKMMELHTGLPMIVLGMQGNFEETAKGRTIANNNGSSVLRRIARNFDGSITEPHIRRYYAWMMIYLEDDSLKGDFNIKACGSAALVERDLQNQQLPNIVTMAAQIPALEWDVAMAGDEFLKSQRFDPKMFKLSDKRKQELIAQAKPPVFPQIEAAKIREEGATQREQLKLQDKAAEREHESTENALERMVEQMKIKIDGELGAAELSAEQQLSLNGIKADLAGLTMKLNTQKQLSGMNGGQASTPPTEPAGRAQPGMSYQQ
jgi:hypothetical protein